MSVGAIKGPESGVEGAIRRAASATGVDFDFLLRTARRESALNPTARARTSSAAGLFQFVEQTWLGTLKRHGAKHGYGAYADLIRQGADGRFRVDGENRRAVLNLRFDPHAASVMAAELASDHAAYLKGRTGRDPSAGELYAAHFLGPEGAARLLQARETRPGASAASLFPEAAGANRPIFYRDGRPATVAEVYANLTRTGGAGPATGPRPEAEPEAPRELRPRDVELASRLEALQRQSRLLELAMGREQAGQTLLSAQLLAAFGPDRSET